MTTKTRHPLIDEIVNIQTRDGLTGIDLARRLGVNQSTISRLINAEMQPSLRVVQAINAQFPELRVRCAQLLRIGIDYNAEAQKLEAAS